jgi:hypothetical protein
VVLEYIEFSTSLSPLVTILVKHSNWPIILHPRFNVSATVLIVLMVMLMLVLARMLIFRTLVKRSTVHNNGDGDVNVRNDVKRSRKFLVL